LCVNEKNELPIQQILKKSIIRYIDLNLLFFCSTYITSKKNDETLLIIINQNTQKKEKTRNKMERPMSKKTKEPLKKVNHKGNIKFPNSLFSQETYQIGKGGGLLERMPN
jgi:hypothetical protein